MDNSKKINITFEQLNTLNELIEDFDFQKVHDVMKILNWEWVDGDGHFTVPTIKQMKNTVLKLAIEAIESNTTIESGGFRVTADDDYLRIDFILETSQSY